MIYNWVTRRLAEPKRGKFETGLLVVLATIIEEVPGKRGICQIARDLYKGFKGSGKGN